MKQTRNHNRIRLRAFIWGLLLSILICAFTPFNNVFRHATPLGGGYFPLAPFYFLFLLTVFTILIKKTFHRYQLFTGTELIFVWGNMILSSGIAYTGFARTFFINLTAPFYFSSVENRWGSILQPLLPDNLFPQDNQAISLIYDGIENGRDMSFFDLASHIPWSAWIAPFISWAIFIIICYFLILCLLSIVSTQAMKNERMNFPLLTVPKMIQDVIDQGKEKRFFTNPYLLLGISLPFMLHLLNGLNFYFPSFPHINTVILAGPYFPKQGLLTGFAKLKLYIYPAFIGFAFLASKQVSFSFWFFYVLGAFFTGFLVNIGLNFPASELGTTFGPTLSRPEETQMVGAFIVFAIFLVWLARSHFKKIAINAFKFNSTQNDHIADKISFWGTGIGIIALSGWFYYHHVPFFQNLLLIAFFLVFTMVATRVVCQGGVTYFTLTAAPLDAVNTILGFKLFSQIALLLGGISQKVLFVDLRESVAPSILHSLKITRFIKNKQAIICAIFFAMVICLAVSAVAMIMLCYKYGIRELQLDWATRTTVSMYNNLVPMLQGTVEQGKSIKYFALTGAVIMGLLSFAYHRFYWWPLHPIGYLMTYSSAMRILWFSFFVGWLVNSLCIRYGGIELFKKMRFFFVGLIMGDFLMGGTWAIVGFFTEYGYQVLPN